MTKMAVMPIYEASIGRGTNLYILVNNPGHMTKMAAMPIYQMIWLKTFQKSQQKKTKNGGPISKKFDMKH